MRHFYINFLLLIAFVLTGANNASAADYCSESRNISKFQNMDINAVGTVYFIQADDYSFTIEGETEIVERHKTKVKNGTLYITIEGKQVNTDKGATIIVTAPDLQKIEFAGVGTFSCEKPLNLKNVDIKLKGVGKLYIADLKCNQLHATISGVGVGEINVKCQDLTAEIEGLGGLNLSGTTKQAKIYRNGIGVVNTDRLTILSKN